MMPGSIDFGYPWWLSWGHASILAAALLGLFAGYKRRWQRRAMLTMTAVALWAGAAFAVSRSVFNVNTVPDLPTTKFLSAGTGRVVDLGAGTGRSAIMVLRARPQATLVALDQFAGSFERHFGKGANPQDRLFANLRAAGVDARATAVAGDMQKLPFEDASFDAAVSAYAIDHLGRDGAKLALAEAARVVRPGGEFLFIVSAQDNWARLLFGPLISHGWRGEKWWNDRIAEAGFRIVETARPPVMFYALAKRL